MDTPKASTALDRERNPGRIRKGTGPGATAEDGRPWAAGTTEIHRGPLMKHSCCDRENADSAARARYTRDMRQERHSVREALRSDLPAAHLGLGVTVMALIVVAGFSGPRWTLVIGGAFTAWFLLALTVIHLGSGRGRDAVRRAYIATFGWGNWI